MTSKTPGSETVRLPFGPVEKMCLVDDEASIGDRELTARLKNVLSEYAVNMARKVGLTIPQADTVACKGLRLHPMAVWGEEWLTGVDPE